MLLFQTVLHYPVASSGQRPGVPGLPGRTTGLPRLRPLLQGEGGVQRDPPLSHRGAGELQLKEKRTL